MEDSDSDRISQLPDSILQHILCFIPIKQAVRTSILSQRWQHLWSSMSDLHFNFTLFAIDSGIELDQNNWQAIHDLSQRFQHFVSHFVFHRDHNTSIRKFHLSLGSSVDAPSPFMEKCVDYAIAHDVEIFHLHALCLRAKKFPDSFFNSKTLREVELRYLYDGVRLPALPHLKTLYLEDTFITDTDEESMFCVHSKEPFSRFPELEKLSLRGSAMFGRVVIAPMLRVLEIIQDALSSYNNNKMERIWAPRLTLFRYEAFWPLECWDMEFPMLEETYLNILTDQSVECMWRTFGCVEMLQHLGNASIVTLTLDTLKALERDGRLIEQSPCPFPNAKCLRVRKGRSDIGRVQKRVINYLRGCDGESFMMEFPEDVCVVEEDCFDDDSDEDFELERFFVW